MAIAARLTAIVQADTGQATANLKGFGAEVTRTRQQVQTETRGIAQTFQSALGGISLQSIGGIVGVASLGGLAVAAGKTVIELGELGQQLRKQRAYFDVWSGGASNATRNLEAMRGAVGGTMSEMEMMTSANQLLSMGLAKTPEELRKLSEMAVMLGGSSRSAGEAINEFALLLANQSILRLDTFGISGARVRERIEELTAATAGLSREQAFMQAVMEVGTQKVDALTAAGVEAADATQKLGAAWKIAREEIALGLDTSGVTGELARIVSGLGTALGGSLGNESSTLKILGADLAYLETQRAAIAAGNSPFKDWRMEQVDAAIADVIQRMQEAQIAGGDWARGVTMGALRVADSLNVAKKAAIGFRLALPNPDTVSFVKAFMDNDQVEFEERLKRYRAGLETLKDPLVNGMAQASPDISRSFSDALSDGAQDAAGRIQGYISGAISAAKGLSGGSDGGDPMAPGQDGPFENVFRALDVAKLGDKSPWAAQLGMDQETAKRLTGQFKQGLLTPEVTSKLIDVDALIQQAGMAAEAEKLTNAFAAEVAKAAGTTPSVALALMGVPSGGNAAGEAQAISVVPSLVGAISADMKTNASLIQAQGGQAWLLLEAGIVAQAKASGVLHTAIQATLDALMEEYTSGK